MDANHRYWDSLKEEIKNGNVRSTSVVKIELTRQTDGITKWLKGVPELFVQPDTATQVKVAEILANFPKVIKHTSFRNEADPFVIALAMTTGTTVVTDEQFTSKNKFSIPKICNHFGIQCLDIDAYIHAMNWAY